MDFYNIDADYVERLHNVDKEVFYDQKGYDKKPYIGIVIQKDEFTYFIPLTSAKSKHTKWKNVTDTNYVLFEIVSRPANSILNGWVYKNVDKSRVKHILSVLEIKKMIPVPLSLCTKINFSEISNSSYKRLLEKEYDFLKPLSNEINKKAVDIYTKQIMNNKILPFFCDYKALEQEYLSYCEYRELQEDELVMI